MPEGHSVHRIARHIQQTFVGQVVDVSSPQGRFADEARVLTGRQMTEAWAVGKQLFIGFDSPNASPSESVTADWVRVHLGIYGAWDFIDATLVNDADTAHSRGTRSMGAPRRRIGETDSTIDSSQKFSVAHSGYAFPPDPIGAVRLRLLTETACADLRGPTACELLSTEQVQLVIERLGPDPQRDASDEAGERFVERVLSRNTSIGQLLMDQNVIAGIGNVYRAEILFRHKIDPHRPGKSLTREQVQDVWRDWVHLLALGVKHGHMQTIEPADRMRLGLPAKRSADHGKDRNNDDRYWVYKRTVLPCRECGTNIAMELMASRKLYWCPTCQR